MKVDFYPISVLPRLSRLFLDYASSREALAPFFSATPWTGSFAVPAQEPALRSAVADLLLEQNRGWGAGPQTVANIERLRKGAGTFVTGQQVALFTGPLFTLLKAATVVHRARQAGDSVPIFWLASEDHDLAEADHVTLPTRHALQTLTLGREGASPGKPVGNLPLGPGIETALSRAAEIIGGTPEFDLLRAAYTPDATFASAFARFLSAVFAEHGLIVIDASTRGFHALGAPVLRHAIEHAAELEAALHERDRLLAERGYHSQVLVAPGSSLLFLIDEAGARLPLRRKNGTWFAGKTPYSKEDLLRILDEAPERLSPNALLRPVFQDYVLPTQAIVGGPAEIAYYAQNQVLYEAILGRTTPVLPRLSATLVEPAIGKILDQHQLSLEDILAAHPDELAHRLGARSLPVEGKLKLAAAGNAVDAELDALLAWCGSLDASLGRAAEVSASKMRYQMNRLRRLAANYQLQRDASIRRHVDTLSFNLFPDRHPQERTIGGVAYLARYGTQLVGTLIEQATPDCPGHKGIWL